MIIYYLLFSRKSATATWWAQSCNNCRLSLIIHAFFFPPTQAIMSESAYKNIVWDSVENLSVFWLLYLIYYSDCSVGLQFPCPPAWTFLYNCVYKNTCWILFHFERIGSVWSHNSDWMLNLPFSLWILILVSCSVLELLLIWWNYNTSANLELIQHGYINGVGKQCI